MKELFILIFFLLSTSHSTLKSQSYRWDIPIGGKTSDGGGTILRDTNGNIYTLGSFQDTVDFDPGPGTYNLISTSLYGDNYILKLDSLGSFLWAGKIGGSGIIGANKMVLDNADNLYITGNFTGNIDFDPGPAIVTLPNVSGGGWIMFVIKLNNAGNYVWGKSMAGMMSSGMSFGLGTDNMCNVFYTGMHYYGVSNPYPGPLLDFDPGPGVFTITPNTVATPFVSKLDSAGNFLWAKSFNGTYSTAGGYGRALTSDISGNIYATGYFQGIVDFDPSSSNFNVTAFGGDDVFVLKLNGSGNFVWAKQLGGTSGDMGLDIKLDNIGNIITTGIYSGTADFNPGIAINNLSSNGQSDVFISKLDNNGNYVWAKSFGGTGPDYCSSLDCDNTGNVYTTGSFSLTVDFDPGSGTENITCSGFMDMFISKLDGSGNFVWAKSMRGMDTLAFSQGSSIAVDPMENVFTSGQFSRSVDFNPDFGLSIRTSVGRDAFISKIGSCRNSLTVSPSIILCMGTSAVLYASGAYSYTWSSGQSSTSSIIVTPTLTTTYTIVGGYALDCLESRTINITVVPNPISVLQTSNSVCPDSCSAVLDAISSSGTSPYTYSLSSGSSISLPFSGLCDGIYTLYTFDTFGCNSNNVFSVACVDVAGLNNQTSNFNSFTLYPNPAKDKITISVENKEFEYFLYNSIGQLIAMNEHNKNETSVGLQSFSQGIYFIEIKVGSEGIRKKLIIE